MPIRNSDGEIIGVAQAINKTPGGAPFSDDDEKVRLPSSVFFLLCSLTIFLGVLTADIMNRRFVL